MLVRRVIEKEVNCCGDCPYYEEENNRGEIRFFCLAKEDKPPVIEDISWRTVYKEISKSCPLK